jgi:hypothetical protein
MFSYIQTMSITQLDMDSDMFEWRKTMEQAHDVVDLGATISQEVNRSIQTWQGMQSQTLDETISDVTEKGKGYSEPERQKGYQ